MDQRGIRWTATAIVMQPTPTTPLIYTFTVPNPLQRVIINRGYSFKNLLAFVVIITLVIKNSVTSTKKDSNACIDTEPA